MKFRTFTKKLRGKAPQLAVLVDPDKFNPALIQLADENKVSCFLVGGSSLKKGGVHKTIKAIKKISSLPVFLFPGDETQLSPLADGLLLLSLLSGRNPEYLIEKHIAAAPLIERMKLPYLPTAYLLIDGGTESTTQKVTGTLPLSGKDKRYILNTALAARQLGFGAVYLEAGSGASKPVDVSLIRLLKKNVSLPLIVGGGLNTAERVKNAVAAGANMVVIGNALEKEMMLLPGFCAALKAAQKRNA